MKKNINTLVGLIFPMAFAVVAVQAKEDSKHGLAVSARRAYNINTEFEYEALAPAAERITPDGDAYNYDDGFVLEDISGNFGNQTTYWGYDNPSQDTGNSILMSRTTLDSGAASTEMEDTIPIVGIDLAYSYEFERKDSRRFGFDISGGYMPLRYENKGTYGVTSVVDEYGYTTGTNPLLPPYQGPFDGAGFLLDSLVSGSTTLNGTVNASSDLDASLWSIRVGPYLEFPMGEHFTFHGSLGLSLGWLYADADWQTTGAVESKGSGEDKETLSGGYIGAEVLWRMTEDWRFGVGGEYEYLGDWEQTWEGNTAKIDFSRSIYLTFSLQREF